MQHREGYEWIDLDLAAPETRLLLPARIVGYTSGDNETPSLPFLISRSGYADDVGRKALDERSRTEPIPDTRLMLIDYTTHLEVLVANLLLGDDAQRAALLQDANLKDIHSFRCVIYFDAPGAPREDLDHYLLASKYPFAAVNLRNLAPMGQKCNERYKHAADILLHDDGTRRRSFDPYDTPGVKLSLQNSRPFAGNDPRTPAWQVEFEPNNEEVQT